MHLDIGIAISDTFNQTFQWLSFQFSHEVFGGNRAFGQDTVKTFFNQSAVGRTTLNVP